LEVDNLRRNPWWAVLRKTAIFSKICRLSPKLKEKDPSSFPSAVQYVKYQKKIQSENSVQWHGGHSTLQKSHAIKGWEREFRGASFVDSWRFGANKSISKKAFVTR